MFPYWILIMCCGLSIMALHTQGYIYYEEMDTSGGFCDAPLFGRIPVGGLRYSVETCERLACGEGQLIREGCDGVLGNPYCRVLANPRLFYPRCCPRCSRNRG